MFHDGISTNYRVFISGPNLRIMDKKRTARDYKFIRLLGEGSFSSVYLAVDADVCAGRPSSISGVPAKRLRKYAIKVCQKSHIKRQGKQLAIMREKEILNILNQCQCKHFIRLYCTFQDTERLFFVMSYAPNGDLLTYMLRHSLSLETVRKFTLQLVSALEQLHKLNIVHRDLKPENILLSEYLDLFISDFGSAKIYENSSASAEKPASTTTPTPVQVTIVNHTRNNASGSDRRNSFVGTAQFVSPEMLKSREASSRSDLWALGLIIYQMLTNVMPFDAPNEYLIYKKIEKLDIEYPDDFDLDARDLVSSLVRLDPNERLGAKDDTRSQGYQSIRRHNFLASIDNEQIRTQPERLANDDRRWSDIIRDDPDLQNIDKITPGLNEVEILRLLTDG